MGTEVFIECGVSEGMFSDEAIVEIAERSFIVPKAEVRPGPDPQRGRVRARLVSNQGGEWVVLPTEYSDSISRSLARIVKE